MTYSNQNWRRTRGRSWGRDPATRSWGRNATTRRYGRLYGGTRQGNRPLFVREEAVESDGTVELRDLQDRIEITADVPEDFGDGDSGVSQADVDVSFTGTDLRIRVTPNEEFETEREIFERRISLTRSVLPDDGEISCADSTLTITLPKSNPS